MTGFRIGFVAWALLSASLFAGRGPIAAIGQTGTPPAPGTPASYVGSSACARCHAPIYDRWKQTRMANVVRDPKEHPDAIIPDFSQPNPLVTFRKDQIAFVYGSKWKQRYFTKVGDDYFPLGAQWDVTHRQWRPYNVAMGTDWWTAFYPPENSGRPTGPTCDGCHSVNYNVKTRTVTEWNVGCEKCHGPGSDHVARPARDTIVNPSRLDPIGAVNVCLQCHSQGRPLVNPVEGRYYDWPVGFRVGLNLRDFWQLEEFKPGETTFTHFPDGTAHKNRMQGNDFTQSVMYTHGVTCSSCHDVHGTRHNADLVKPVSAVCLTCHGPRSPNGPHTATIEQHTHHRAGSTGSECVSCHMPAIEQTIGDVMVRSHTFRFIPPSMTESSKIPNPCTSCHKDKSNVWATAALRRWPEFSPWRVGL
jgi:predicted CXXCH cytochrome family protein